MSAVRSERGQSTVLAVLFLTVLLGMTAAVLDVGAWFRTQRAAQATADASALAAAQALPADPATATSLALGYAAKNGGGLAAADVTLSDGETANDTVTVRVRHTVPGFFSSVFGISTVAVSAKAAARGFKPGSAKWVAPIVVNIQHPDLEGTPGCPCFGPGNQTTLPLGKTGAPGAFDLLNLDPSQTNGTIGASTLADWVDHGFDQYLPLGGYYSDPGAKFNSSEIQAALADRMQTVLLFPVYDTLTGTGSNATYHIIGWAGFHLTGVGASGSNGSLTGWFTNTVWAGIQSTIGDNSPDLGVHSVELIQ